MTTSPTTCPFCQRIQGGETLLDRDRVVAIPDASPLNPGHTLVVPRRHEPDFLALTPDELRCAFQLVGELRALLQERYAPDGFNVGANIGAAAGQTVDHAHLHIIPRFKGDVEEPRGGLRWIIPERARYWP
ncbi:HIT family protein [Corallococcus sp. RDP092CA]|uniref:HIT family protein n=1 Tax=Corallococcus sp. RDP092CA TaxID=3109369 RepID=UPI0035B0E59C